MEEVKKKRLSAFSIEFWLKKGLSYEEADLKRNSLRPIRKEYWLKKGYSETESIQKALETKDNNNKKGAQNNGQRSKTEQRETSIRCIEYWLKKGYSETESIQKVKEKQSTFTKEKCINKYGEIKGLEIWNKRQIQWLKAFRKNDLVEINKKKGKAFNLQFLLEKYGNIDSVINVLKQRNIFVEKTIIDFEQKIQKMIIEHPERAYHSPKNFCKFFQNIQFDLLGIAVKNRDNFVKKFLKPGKFLLLKGNKQSWKLHTKEGLLRSAHEIYFYDILKSYSITNFDVDKCYPNSNFRYDFYLPDYDIYIEIAPLYYKDEKYKEKMDKKSKIFGSVILKSSLEYLPFVENLISKYAN